MRSFGLAALFNAKPQPNRDFWRSQSAKACNLRVERGVGGASAVEFWAPRVTAPGRRGGPVGRGYRGGVLLRHSMTSKYKPTRSATAKHDLFEARWPDLVGHAPPKPGHRAMVLMRFCPAAVSKDRLTSDFEQHVRVISSLGEPRVGEERLGKHGTT